LPAFDDTHVPAGVFLFLSADFVCLFPCGMDPGGALVMNDLVVIVRTAGERTFELSHSLLLAQVPADRVLVVDERPFEKALRRTYELGIEHAARWTMTLDADVLLRPG